MRSCQLVSGLLLILQILVTKDSFFMERLLNILFLSFCTLKKSNA